MLFRDELESLARQRGARLHYLIDDVESLSAPALLRLVPDLAERDVRPDVRRDHRRRRGHRQPTRHLARSPGPRIAAAAAAAILIELTCTPPGDGYDKAVATALRFLDAGISAL